MFSGVSDNLKNRSAEVSCVIEALAYGIDNALNRRTKTRVRVNLRFILIFTSFLKCYYFNVFLHCVFGLPLTIKEKIYENIGIFPLSQLRTVKILSKLDITHL
jgi:hypothetical protein